MSTQHPSRSDDPTRMKPDVARPGGDAIPYGSGTERSARDTSMSSGHAPHVEHGDDMRDKAGEMADSAMDKAQTMANTASDKAKQATGTATEKLDQQRDSVAGSLDKVATTLRDRSQSLPGGDASTQAAQTAAQKLETASGYVREHDVNDMLSDLEETVRAHPKESLAVALAAGFLLGRALRD